MSGQRKRIWIDSFQTGLVLRITLFVVLYLMVACGFFALWEQINAAFVQMRIDAYFFRSLLVRSVLALLILLPPLILDVVRFSHRLVGPLHRFRKAIQAVAAGEPVALVQLREGDLLLDFNNDFNAMLKHLEQQGYVLLKTPEPAVNAETPQSVGGPVPASAHAEA